MKKPYPTCSFILTRGTLCESPALKDNDFCYFHNRDRQRKENLQQARELKCSDQFYKYPMQQELLNPEIIESLDIPSLDDGPSIQVAVTNIVRAVLSGHISDKRAGLALFGCQIAAGNLNHANVAISQFEADKAATTDANPIPPYLTAKPHPAGYLDDLKAARKLIDSAQKLSKENPSPQASTLETRNEKLETSLNCHSERSEEPASSLKENESAKSSTLETRNKKLETPPATPPNVGAPSNRSGVERLGGNGNEKRDTIRVLRNPGPNSKTFAEHVKIAAALFKGTLDAREFQKEQKKEQRNGSSS